jgi:ribosome-associated heat shock protein Hsp15
LQAGQRSQRRNGRDERPRVESSIGIGSFQCDAEGSSGTIPHAAFALIFAAGACSGPAGAKPPYRVGPEMDRVRVDKWLWAARLFKTRSAASEAVLGGRVHVNGARVKPAKEVAVGDTLELTLRSGKRTVQVTSLSDKRGPAAAATLYAETRDSIAARERDALQRRLANPLGADLGERPSKRDRRRLEALRRRAQGGPRG